MNVPLLPSPAPWTRWLWLMLAGMVSACLVVVLHELGHHLFNLAFGFPNSLLHYSSAKFAGEDLAVSLVVRGRHAEVAVPLDQLAWAYAGGPLVSLLITAASAWLQVARAQPIWFIVGYQSMIVRVVMGLSQLLFSLVTGQVPGGSDETILAAILRLPVPLVLGVELVPTMLLLIWMAVKIPAGQRLNSWSALIVSTTAGWLLWFGPLGQWLLP